MAGELVRTPEEQAALKGDDRGAILALDAAGEPCACGTKPEEMCLAHYAVHGHRRHVRPGRLINDKGARRVRRPRYVPDPDDA